jgi:hypothetical protein
MQENFTAGVKMKGIRVSSDRVRVERSHGASYEDAVKQVAEVVDVSEGHPAFDSLSEGFLSVHDGFIYGKSVEYILGD